MTWLTEVERVQIEAAVVAVETRTRGELVAVIAAEADDYLFIPTLWAALIALALPAVLAMWPEALAGAYLYAGQILVFVGCALLFRWRPLRMWLIPRRIKRERAHRLAQQQFLAQNLHHTRGRTGILLFVAVAERYVEIIADQGINDVVPEPAWDNIVVEFVAQIKNQQVAAGFLQAIQQCGQLLEQHFPADAGDTDELPNHLVEI